MRLAICIYLIVLLIIILNICTINIELHVTVWKNLKLIKFSNKNEEKSNSRPMQKLTHENKNKYEMEKCKQLSNFTQLCRLLGCCCWTKLSCCTQPFGVYVCNEKRNALELNWKVCISCFNATAYRLILSASGSLRNNGALRSTSYFQYSCAVVVIPINKHADCFQKWCVNAWIFINVSNFDFIVLQFLN